MTLQAKTYPDESFMGVVTEISDVSVFKQGELLYLVQIKLAMDEVPNLKWGLTVTTEFE